MRSPLLIRGARQVGKTHLIESFGNAHFENLVTINFEDMPQCIEDFETLDPSEIITRLQINSGKSINPNNTLLFLDEIQDCPNAIRSLRYFKEKMPELAVIAAGSLLDFVLNDANFRMPVGRVEYLYLYPISFEEFLNAKNETFFLEWLSELKPSQETPDNFHEKGLALLKEYCLVGGMPEVVAYYLSEQTDVLGLQNMQSKLIQSYNHDFGKYANTKRQHKNLQTIYRALPQHVGKQVTYSKMAADLTSHTIKETLNLLNLAGLCHFIVASNGEGIPLSANENPKKFKVNLLDTGWYLRDLRLDAEVLQNQNIQLVNSGTLMEQFVGQQLLTLQPYFEPGQLHFWARDSRGSQAEVDYLWQVGEHIIPIEVKSNSAGHLKSLYAFMNQFNSKFGIKISAAKLNWEREDLLNIPLYMAHLMPELIQAVN